MTRPDTEYETILPEQPVDDVIPPEEQPPRRKSGRLIIVLLIVFSVLAGIVYILYSTMLGYTGFSRVKSYLSNAKMIYEITQLWQEEGNPPLQSHIGQLGTEAPEDSFEDFLCRYTISERGGWYAIKCDAEGNVLCVWYSRREITENEVRPIPWRSSLEDLKNPFRFTNTVVCYPQEGGTPIDEPIY